MHMLLLMITYRLRSYVPSQWEPRPPKKTITMSDTLELVVSRSSQLEDGWCSTISGSNGPEACCKWCCHSGGAHERCTDRGHGRSHCRNGCCHGGAADERSAHRRQRSRHGGNWCSHRCHWCSVSWCNCLNDWSGWQCCDWSWKRCHSWSSISGSNDLGDYWGRRSVRWGNDLSNHRLGSCYDNRSWCRSWLRLLNWLWSRR